MRLADLGDEAIPMPQEATEMFELKGNVVMAARPPALLTEAQISLPAARTSRCACAETGFCPRCQATQTLRSLDTVALVRSAHRMRLVRRRQLECLSYGAFLSMIETPIRTELVAGK